MSSFGYKNRYYTWNSKEESGLGREKSKKIKIVNRIKLKKNKDQDVNKIPGTSSCSERVTQTHPSNCNPYLR